MVPASSYSCSFTGNCAGSPLFLELQRQLNRVRPIYGLPADVATDGVIGSKTLAKLIKTAQAIVKRLGENFDGDALSDYAYYDIAHPSTKSLAAEADVVVASLRRNGYAIGRVPPDVASQSLIDPYVTSAASPSSMPNMHLAPIGPLIVNVGPTATQTAPPAPPTPFKPGIPLGAKIAGGVVLGLGVVGGITAVVMGLRNR